MSESFLQTYRSARRVGTPLFAVSTQEPAGTMKQLNAVLPDAPAVRWDIVRGFVGLNASGEAALERLLDGKDPTKVRNPSEAISLLGIEEKDRALPQMATVFVLQGQRYLVAPDVVQAIWNLRDPFMQLAKALVLLGPAFVLPAELAQDVLMLDEPVPDAEQLTHIIQEEYEARALPLPEAAVQEEAVQALRGLSAVAAGTSIAMSLKRSGLDMSELRLRKCQMVDETPGLSLLKGEYTFDDIGGLAELKGFLRRVMAGRRSPRLVVVLEEIEKVVMASMSDGTGVAADQLQMLLNVMEQNRHMGSILAGPPGSGKSLIANALANTYNIMGVAADLGAAKDKSLGNSEAMIRQLLKTICAIGGAGRVLWLATSNGLTEVRPELRRRFNLGIWMVDLPDAEERRSIWELNLQRHGLPYRLEDTPESDGWSGSDIRNVCQLCDDLGYTPVEASSHIIPAKDLDPEGLKALRIYANGRFLNASAAGPYRMGTRAAARTQKRQYTGPE